MIKDYQHGRISAQNLKVAINSLIEKQSLSNNNKQKPQLSKPSIKTQRSRINIPNSYKSSLVSSLRNTPRNAPLKSKSQKMYQQQHNSFNKFNNNNNNNKKIRQFNK